MSGEPRQYSVIHSIPWLGASQGETLAILVYSIIIVHNHAAWLFKTLLRNNIKPNI